MNNKQYQLYWVIPGSGDLQSLVLIQISFWLIRNVTVSIQLSTKWLYRFPQTLFLSWSWKQPWPKQIAEFISPQEIINHRQENEFLTPLHKSYHHWWLSFAESQCITQRSPRVGPSAAARRVSPVSTGAGSWRGGGHAEKEHLATTILASAIPKTAWKDQHMQH